MPLYTEDLAKIPVFSRPPPSQTSTDAWEKAAQPLPADMFTQAPRPGSLDEMLPLPSSQFDLSLPPAPDADLLFGLDPPPDPMQLDIFNLDHDTMAMWSSAPANCEWVLCIVPFLHQLTRFAASRSGARLWIMSMSFR